MLTHEQIWQGIDRLAGAFGYSPSGLAKQSGLDPTSFNKSKRIGPDGKPRWPSTESLSRILAATGATMNDFVGLVDNNDNPIEKNTIPLIGFAQAGTKGFFDEQGYPHGDSWDEVDLPQSATYDSDMYALKVNGDSMEPLYRKGDVLVVSPRSKLRKGDRIVVKTAKGEVMAKEMIKQSSNILEVRSLNDNYENIEIPTNEVIWTARIVWVSQ